MNFPKCPKCGRTLIEEEVDVHECRKVLDYRIEGKILWLFDGEIWYLRKLRSTENLHQGNQPQNGQNPNLGAISLMRHFMSFLS